MNIQDMESSGELNQLRDKWFNSPRQCDGFDLADSHDKFPVDEFIPLTILSAAFIAVAVTLASINRFIWGPTETRIKLQDSWTKCTGSEGTQTVGTSVPNWANRKCTARIRPGSKGMRTVGTSVPNWADKKGVVHIIRDHF